MIIGSVANRNVFGRGAYLLFPGKPIKDRFNKKARYTLKVNASVPPIHAVYDSTAIPKINPYRYHWDVESSTVAKGHNPNAPNISTSLYAARLTTNKGANASANINVRLYAPYRGKGKAYIWVDLLGANSASHRYQVVVNGINVGSGSFTGKTPHLKRFTLDRTKIKWGNNTVTVTNLAGSAYSRFYVNRARIGMAFYAHAYGDQANFLYGNTDRVRKTQVSGLTRGGGLAFRVQSNTNKLYYMRYREYTRHSNGRYSMYLARAKAKSEYFVSTWAKLKKPVFRKTVLAANSVENVLDLNSNYVLIAPAPWINTPQMNRLVAVIAAQGHTPSVVGVESIYSNYGHKDGRANPWAIKAFIRRAHANGAEYVVLVGGETYDHNNQLGLGSYSVMPTLYVKTRSLQLTPSDASMGDVNNDGVAEVVMARLPVFNLAELNNLVTKTQAFSQQAPQAGLFLSDKNDPYNAGYSFLADSQQLAVPVAAQQLSLQTTAITPLRSALLKRLNTGGGMVNYTGHSSGSKLGLSNTLLNNGDVNYLTNYGAPFIANLLGCTANDYTTPTQNTLGATLMDGLTGAAVVIGQTTRVNPYHAVQVGKVFYQQLAQGASIGKALLAGQHAFAASQGKGLNRADVLLGTALLGLPSITLNANPAYFLPMAGLGGQFFATGVNYTKK